MQWLKSMIINTSCLAQFFNKGIGQEMSHVTEPDLWPFPGMRLSPQGRKQYGRTYVTWNQANLNHVRNQLRYMSGQDQLEA